MVRGQICVGLALSTCRLYLMVDSRYIRQSRGGSNGCGDELQSD